MQVCVTVIALVLKVAANGAEEGEDCNLDIR